MGRPVTRAEQAAEKLREPHKPLPPGRVPHVRPSVHGLNTTGEAPQCFLSMNHTVTDGVKAFEQCHFRPMYAGRTWGTRPGNRACGGSRTFSASLEAPEVSLFPPMQTFSAACLKPLALPALKRMIKLRLFPGALKRSFPRMNAGASATNRPVSGSQADTKARSQPSRDWIAGGLLVL